MVWVSNLLLAPQSAKLKLKWFKAFNTREFFVISLLHTSSLIRSHTHTITTRNAISVPKLFHLSWIFSFSFKDVSQWKQSKSGLRIEIHYVWKNGTEWHENKSKSGTFYDLRAIFFLARRPTHYLYIYRQKPNWNLLWHSHKKKLKSYRQWYKLDLVLDVHVRRVLDIRRLFSYRESSNDTNVNSWSRCRVWISRLFIWLWSW